MRLVKPALKNDGPIGVIGRLQQSKGRYMKMSLTRICFAIAALLFGSFAAQAADLPPMSYKAPAYVGPSYVNWSGFYVGINGGYQWGKTTFSGNGADFSTSPDGWLAGGTLGYNFQPGTWVWGLEGDFDWSDLNGTQASISCGGNCTIKNTWLGTARLRLGYAGWNNWLPYITGGLAYGSVYAGNNFGSVTRTKAGWTAGAGVEWALLSNWSAKIEYLYVDLGSADCGTAICTLPANETANYTANIARVGLNYRF
jgi:outer membrane immunogenic protein